MTVEPALGHPPPLQLGERTRVASQTFAQRCEPSCQTLVESRSLRMRASSRRHVADASYSFLFFLFFSPLPEPRSLPVPPQKTRAQKEKGARTAVTHGAGLG